jgi:hypothetical protein
LEPPCRDVVQSTILSIGTIFFPKINKNKCIDGGSIINEIIKILYMF